MIRYKRRYREGTCQECGWTKNVTKFVWWVNEFSMILCAECARGYRPVLLRPGNLSDPYWTIKIKDKEPTNA